MVTQQVEPLARQSYFDALAELFVAPDHADTYDRLRDALARVALIGIGHGLRRSADDALPLHGFRKRLLALVGASLVVVDRVGRLLAPQGLSLIHI